MKILAAIIMLGISLFLSCTSTVNELVNNKTFDLNETKELLNLIQKFDHSICEIENIEHISVSECYKSFAQRIWKEAQEGDYNIGIGKDQQDEILGALSEALRNEIWFYGTAVLRHRDPEHSKNTIILDTVESISLNQEKYFRFLRDEAANINSNTKMYFDILDAIGDISPSMIADVMKNYSNYDITDERVRLLYVIHYLTLNQNNLIHQESYERLIKE